IVWWRRIVYFLTLASSLFLVALPWLPAALSTRAKFPHQTQWLGAKLQPLFELASYLVPNWVGTTWLKAFGEEPVLFLIGASCLAAAMLTGLWQDETIRSRSGEIWHPERWKEVPKWARNAKSTWVYRLRSNKKVIRAYRFFAWRVLPTLALIACVLLVLWLLRKQPAYTVFYGTLILLALFLRSWVFRGLYKATDRNKQAQAKSLGAAERS